MNYLDAAFGAGTTETARAAVAADGQVPSLAQSQALPRIYVTFVWPHVSQSLILDVDAKHVTFSNGLCGSAEQASQAGPAVELAAALMPLAAQLGIKTGSVYADGDVAEALGQAGFTEKAEEPLLFTIDLSSGGPS
jgi:hypothetical protein